jgi:hypothetical protein
MKRADGTAMLVGGDQDQVVGKIADLYIERRDFLRASRSTRGITVSTLTNQDAADISLAIRERLQAAARLRLRRQQRRHRRSRASDGLVLRADDGCRAW